MLIEQHWTPGVWIDGHQSTNTDTTDAFGTFAHHVHEDLLAAQVVGDIPADVEITLSASILTPLWEPEDGPIVLLLHIRFTGLTEPEHTIARKNVTAETLYSIDHHSTNDLTPEQLRQYSGALFFVDQNNRPRYIRMHHLLQPTS
ncbi:hypothetical protein LWC34_45030 [Kibdelosporangium philippinense]|uniref:Uncharacterized protein n=1 Tax=Kibdelosporangium philippinense TaxID=211113 RepID=A0ABS8ZQ91_9PSEU|nr:hypothetical protein [Kibdelosporangium philippinense]MCE7009923.1 hypothetical protein [Kibdelosporangium philippinense]